MRSGIANQYQACDLHAEAEIKIGEIDKYVDIINRSSFPISEIVNDFLQSYRNDHSTISHIYITQLLDEILVIAKDRLLLKNISVKKFYATSPLNYYWTNSN